MFISHKYSSFLGQNSWKWLLEPIHTSFVVSQRCPPTPSLKHFSLQSVPGWVFVPLPCTRSLVEVPTAGLGTR